MWPKVIAQLFELLPHISRLLPMADKFLTSKAAAEKANEAALTAMAEGVRGDLGQVTKAHAGLYRQLQEQSAQIAEVFDETKRARLSIEQHEHRMETLEHKDGQVRFTNARRLLYILQGVNSCQVVFLLLIAPFHFVGVFGETTSPEQQFFWIVENCKTFRDCNGVSIVKDAMSIATGKHDLLNSWTDIDTNHFNVSPEDKADFLEEVCTEMSIYLGMLYHVVEVLKGYDDFAEELSEYSYQ